MNKQKKNNVFIPIIIGLVCLLLVGTFFDYSISSALVNPNSIYGLIGANYGQIVAYIVLYTGGLILLKNIGLHRFSGSIAIFIALLMNISDGYSYGLASLELMFASIGVFINIGLSNLLFKWLKKHDLATVNVAYFLIGCVTLQVVIITILKEIMSRPRMIALLNNSDLSFQPWYQCNYANKQAWLTIVSNSDYLKSFPSGHSGAAAMSFALASVIALANNSKKGYGLALVYTLLVMLSRIRVGAHFLSDTSVGALIGILSVTLMYYLCLNKNKKGN